MNFEQTEAVYVRHEGGVPRRLILAPASARRRPQRRQMGMLLAGRRVSSAFSFSIQH